MNNAYRHFRIVFILTTLLMITLKVASAETLLNPTTKTIFTPLLADPIEPRVSVMPWLNQRFLNLDIGTSADIYQSNSKNFAVGVDFGTWSLLRRSEDFKFPVDAVDYLFGINTSWKKTISYGPLPFDELSGRIRISHISAHFEDGHYLSDGSGWIPEAGGPTIPFTYSREFLDLVLALSSPGHRIYAGYQYIYHTIPGGINPNSFHAGAELSAPGNTYLAADVKLLPIWQSSLLDTKCYRGTWNLQAGMRLNSIGLERVRIACNYFTGISMHGMYFYRPESYTTLGLIMEL
ncbi:MAG: DUF1207 domain-containing protein [Chlorobium sp.]|jgi:Protein of unknown function (DUF1207)|nr:MAG: DUF1207 domain-containing protein [Chlorobium sp.]